MSKFPQLAHKDIYIYKSLQLADTAVKFLLIYYFSVQFIFWKHLDYLSKSFSKIVDFDYYILIVIFYVLLKRASFLKHHLPC